MISYKHIIKSVMVILTITLFSCDGTYKNKKKLTLRDDAPIGIGKEINMKYTDSGKVMTNLRTPLLMDYSNYEFPYREFPNGVIVNFWGEDTIKITSDYAIRFESTGLIDLRKNVVIVKSDSLTLKAEQLYWDQENKWMFTDVPYQITFPDGSYNDGQGFDSSEDFTNFLSRKNTGVQIIEKTENDGE